MGEAAVLVLLGILVGALTGGLGGGGGVIAVPLFMWFLGMSVVDAGTFSLIAVASAALIAVVMGAAAKEIHWGWAVGFGAMGVFGAFGGSFVAGAVDEMLVLLVFGIVVALATVSFAARTFRRPRLLAKRRPSTAVALGAAAGIGGITGLVGVGGGFLIAPALMALLRMPPRTAIATSSAVILFNSISSLLARSTIGFQVDARVAGILLLGSVAGSICGRWISARVSSSALRVASGGLLVVCCITVATSIVQGLWMS